MSRDSKKINMNADVVRDFGFEWSRFDQSSLRTVDQVEMFEGYFHIFPWDSLPPKSTGADISCGSGRWASLVAPRVGHLSMVDPSGEALAIARQSLSNAANVSFHQASVDGLPFEEGSLDFAYSLGVLHHVPDTAGAIRSVAHVLKPGAPFLIYLYYAFDQRPRWFRAIWRATDMLRRLVSRMPARLKYIFCDGIALLVYLPLARTAMLLERIGMLPDSWPMSYYRNRAFYVIRTDALDRFGTRLEQRFSRQQIKIMLQSAGFTGIRFSDTQPFWCVVGIKR